MEDDFRNDPYILVTYKKGELRGSVQMKEVQPEQMAALSLFLETYAQIMMSEVIVRTINEQKVGLLVPRH